jgi:hypothetical protein
MRLARMDDVAGCQLIFKALESFIGLGALYIKPTSTIS